MTPACPRCHRPPAPELYPARVLRLEGSKSSATVTLHQKHGIWFVAKADGALSLADFSSTKGWGDTERAVHRAAFHLGMKISDITSGGNASTPPPDPVRPPASLQQRGPREPAKNTLRGGSINDTPPTAHSAG